jgi:hypothetical protein
VTDAAPPEVHPAPNRDRIELLATVLLAIAAVATAWSSYQAARWNGEQAKAASQTNAIRIDAAREAALAEAETEIDVALFIQWVDAYATDDDALADFYVERFRPEFVPAFDAWLAMDPFEGSDAPLSPFAMPEYTHEAQTEADQLDQDAEQSAATVRRDIQRSTNYVLGVVLFAVSLFFAGMSTKLTARGHRIAMLATGYALFLGTAAWIATFPVTIAV